MQLKLLLLIILTVGAISSYFIFNTTKDTTNNTLVVGTAAGYAPYVSMNEQGTYEGFDIDFASALATKLNKKLVLKDLGSMTSLMMALEQGSIDTIIWGISITQDRLKKFAMIHYQGQNTTSNPLLFWNQIPPHITDLSSMKGMTVCVEPSSSQSAILSKYNNINIVPTEKVDDALLNVRYGKADAALVDPAIAKKFKTKFPEIKVLNIPLKVEDQVQGVGVVTTKNNSELIASIQKAVAELKSDGTMKNLEKKWNLE
jgi:ABC-type amino acid transport substrate-binding protein